MRRFLLAAAATLVLTGTLVPYASAQCLDCAMYPNRDHLNGGKPTPEALQRAAKDGTQPSGGASANVSNANAAIRGRHLKHRKQVQQ